jgi:hypothetical protein
LTPVALVWIDGNPDVGDRLEFEQQVQVDRQGPEVEDAAAVARDARDHLNRCLDQQDAASASRISLEAEVPEALFDGMRAFLSSRPEWDQYRVITSALAGFLFQNGCGDRCVAQHYLNGLFMKPGE